MSWLWGNETTEQAQIVVSALQGELDEREGKIQALEAALRREQHALTLLVQAEIDELEGRRRRLQEELAEVDELLREKQAALKKDKPKKKSSKAKAKPKAKDSDGGKGSVNGSKPKTPMTAPTVATMATTSDATAATTAEATTAATENAETKTPETAVAAVVDEAKPRKTPMDGELKKIAKVEPNVAFIIQRSTNANTVVYAGHLSGKQLDPSKPLDVYWIMYEKPGNPREELNMIERNSAYGVTCAPTATKDQYSATLSSLKDRDCVLLIDEHGNIQARTVINGKKNMILRRVFVQMTTSWGIPAVDYVEIFGLDPVTHAPVYEKKLNK